MLELHGAIIEDQKRAKTSFLAVNNMMQVADGEILRTKMVVHFLVKSE